MSVGLGMFGYMFEHTEARCNGTLLPRISVTAIQNYFRFPFSNRNGLALISSMDVEVRFSINTCDDFQLFSWLKLTNNLWTITYRSGKAIGVKQWDRINGANNNNLSGP